MPEEVFGRQVDFKFTSKSFQPLETKTDDGKLRLRVVASSSLEDLSGDVVTPNALKEMADSAKGMTIFRNHSYKVPGDIFGSVENAWVKQTSDLDDDGKPISELLMDVGVFDKNPDNVQTHQAVLDGTMLGVSIGAMIPKGAAKKNKSGGITFDSLKLKEASIVGIPQNTRSWVQYATKALRSIEARPDEDDEDTNQAFVTATVESPQITTWTSGTVPVSKARVWVTQNEKGSNVTVDTEPVAEGDIQQQVDGGKSSKKDAEPEVEKAEVEKAEEPDLLKDLDIDWENLPEGDQAAADALYAEMDDLDAGNEDVSFAAELDLTKAPLSSAARNNLSDSQFACPSKRKYPIQDKAHIRNALARCGDPSNDQCGCDTVRAAAAKAGIGSEKAAEPLELVEEAEVVTANPDEPPAQELEQSVPDNAEAAADSGEDALTSDTVSRSASMLADIVKAQATENLDLRKRLGEAEQARDKLTQELRDTRSNLKLAKEIVEKIAKTPLGRKAVVADAVSDFASLESKYGGIYSAEVLKSLEKK